jgi:hypothetical protein
MINHVGKAKCSPPSHRPTDADKHACRRIHANMEWLGPVAQDTKVRHITRSTALTIAGCAASNHMHHHQERSTPQATAWSLKLYYPTYNSSLRVHTTVDCTIGEAHGPNPAHSTSCSSNWASPYNAAAPALTNLHSQLAKPSSQTIDASQTNPCKPMQAADYSRAAIIIYMT